MSSAWKGRHGMPGACLTKTQEAAWVGEELTEGGGVEWEKKSVLTEGTAFAKGVCRVLGAEMRPSREQEKASCE